MHTSSGYPPSYFSHPGQVPPPGGEPSPWSYSRELYPFANRSVSAALPSNDALWNGTFVSGVLVWLWVTDFAVLVVVLVPVRRLEYDLSLEHLSCRPHTGTCGNDHHKQ